jgi:acyl-coenzyme A synthetase/AMP-(fatty) acid ligase
VADVVFRTSGSTGEAKRIVRTEASLLADAAMLTAAFPEFWQERPVVVSSVRPEHMYGALWRVRAPAIAGCAVEPSVLVSVEELAARCARHRRVLFVTTPSFLENALAHPDFRSLHGAFAGIVTSGSLLRGETAHAVAAAVGCCPTEIFGSTETGSVARRRRVDGDDWQVFDGVAVTAAADGRLTVDSPYAMRRPYEMGDLVELTAPRAFRLLGRADRCVKILESFVSLTQVEAVFSAHPYVARVRVDTTGGRVPRLGALIVLSPEGIARHAAGPTVAVAARLRRDLLPTLGPLAFPRRLRFVRALPVNEQGKTTAAAARAALDAWCAEPVVTSWRATADRLDAELVFPPDAECFRGHFPGFAVLPGVAQLVFLRHFSHQAFADFPETVTYRRLKFQKIVRPGTRVSLSVLRRGVGAFAFTLAGPSGPCASGLVERTSS